MKIPQNIRDPIHNLCLFRSEALYGKILNIGNPLGIQAARYLANEEA